MDKLHGEYLANKYDGGDFRMVNKMKSTKKWGEVRFIISYVLAVAFLTIPYLLPENNVKSLTVAMQEAGVPLVNFYSDLFVDHEYGDWRGRLICTYLAFLLSPFLVNQGFNYVRHVVCPLVSEIEGQKQRRNWIVFVCFALAAICLFAIVRLPGIDIVITRGYENIFGIKSSLILVSEIMAFGGILGRGIFEATLVKE